MVPTVLHIVSKWGDECFYRISDTGQLQSLFNSGVWGACQGYGGTLEGVVEYYCEGDPSWSHEWVEEGDAGYASKG